MLYEHNTTRHPQVLLCIPPSVPRQLCPSPGASDLRAGAPPSHASLCPTADQSSRHSGGSQMSLPGEGVQSVLASVLHPRSSQLTSLSETVYVFAGLLPLLHKKRRLQEHRTSSVLFTATSPVSRAELGSQATESYLDRVIPGESDLGSKDESDWLTNWVICSA